MYILGELSPAGMSLLLIVRTSSVCAGAQLAHVQALVRHEDSEWTSLHEVPPAAPHLHPMVPTCPTHKKSHHRHPISTSEIPTPHLWPHIPRPQPLLHTQVSELRLEIGS